MAVTPVYAFRYPTLADQPHGPDQVKHLAEDVEAKMVLVDAELAKTYRARSLLVSDAASVTFSSIPSTLNSLRIVCSARSSEAVVANELRMRINGNTGANYFGNYTIQQNATVTPGAHSGQTYGFVGMLASASAANGANAGSAAEIVFPAWDAPGGRTQMNWLWTTEYFDATANSWFSQGGGLVNIAGPYTSITLFPSGGNLKSGSEFTMTGFTV